MVKPVQMRLGDCRAQCADSRLSQSGAGSRDYSAERQHHPMLRIRWARQPHAVMQSVIWIHSSRGAERMWDGDVGAFGTHDQCPVGLEVCHQQISCDVFGCTMWLVLGRVFQICQYLPELLAVAQTREVGLGLELGDVFVPGCGGLLRVSAGRASHL